MPINKIIPSYFGSKNVPGLFQFIMNKIPPHVNYIEGFLGSGIILQHITNSGIIVGIDKDACIIDKFNSYGRGLHNHFYSGSFIDVFLSEIPHLNCPDTFIFLDPPYLHSTRSCSKRYKHEMSILEHRCLLAFAKSLSCSIAISCYDSELYSTQLSHWKKETCKAQTRHGSRIETLYMNYDITKTHTTMFTGTNYTDRQRIKRKAKRTVQKFLSMPSREKQAILNEMVNHNIITGY